nr:MAG TPA: hypothetical protein [Caudoviricetes sp.]
MPCFSSPRLKAGGGHINQFGLKCLPEVDGIQELVGVNIPSENLLVVPGFIQVGAFGRAKGLIDGFHAIQFIVSNRLINFSTGNHGGITSFPHANFANDALDLIAYFVIIRGCFFHFIISVAAGILAQNFILRVSANSAPVQVLTS